MNDRDFDELVDEMKRSHNPPPEVPRDRMWARIEEQRRARAAQTQRPTRHVFPLPRPWRIGLGMAAVLAVGFFVGRLTLQPDASPQVAAGPEASVVERPAAGRGQGGATQGRNGLVSFAATSLFQRADALLTGLQTSRCDQTELDPLPVWAGGMLVQTRLLLDSDLAAEPDMKALLQDLELILVRIAGLSRDDCATDVARIRKDLRDKATLDRLRLAAAGA